MEITETILHFRLSVLLILIVLLTGYTGNERASWLISFSVKPRLFTLRHLITKSSEPIIFYKNLKFIILICTLGVSKQLSIVILIPFGFIFKTILASAGQLTSVCV